MIFDPIRDALATPSVPLPQSPSEAPSSPSAQSTAPLPDVNVGLTVEQSSGAGAPQASAQRTFSYLPGATSAYPQSTSSSSSAALRAVTPVHVHASGSSEPPVSPHPSQRSTSFPAFPPMEPHPSRRQTFPDPRFHSQNTREISQHQQQMHSRASMPTYMGIQTYDLPTPVRTRHAQQLPTRPTRGEEPQWSFVPPPQSSSELSRNGSGELMGREHGVQRERSEYPFPASYEVQKTFSPPPLSQSERRASGASSFSTPPIGRSSSTSFGSAEGMMETRLVRHIASRDEDRSSTSTRKHSQNVTFPNLPPPPPQSTRSRPSSGSRPPSRSSSISAGSGTRCLRCGLSNPCSCPTTVVAPVGFSGQPVAVSGYGLGPLHRPMLMTSSVPITTIIPLQQQPAYNIGLVDSEMIRTAQAHEPRVVSDGFHPHLHQFDVQQPVFLSQSLIPPHLHSTQHIRRGSYPPLAPSNVNLNVMRRPSFPPGIATPHSQCPGCPTCGPAPQNLVAATVHEDGQRMPSQSQQSLPQQLPHHIQAPMMPTIGGVYESQHQITSKKGEEGGKEQEQEKKNFSILETAGKDSREVTVEHQKPEERKAAVESDEKDGGGKGKEGRSEVKSVKVYGRADGMLNYGSPSPPPKSRLLAVVPSMVSETKLEIEADVAYVGAGGKVMMQDEVGKQREEQVAMAMQPATKKNENTRAQPQQPKSSTKSPAPQFVPQPSTSSSSQVQSHHTLSSPSTSGNKMVVDDHSPLPPISQMKPPQILPAEESNFTSPKLDYGSPQQTTIKGPHLPPFSEGISDGFDDVGLNYGSPNESTANDVPKSTELNYGTPPPPPQHPPNPPASVSSALPPPPLENAQSKSDQLQIEYDPRRVSARRYVGVPLTLKEAQRDFSTSKNPLRKVKVKDWGYLRSEEVGEKRRRGSDEGKQEEESKRKRVDEAGRWTASVGVSKEVMRHYDSRPELGRTARMKSVIIGLKNYNNWVKSVLINKFCSGIGKPKKGNRVLDIGCGKGGDLLKWQKTGTEQYVGADIASVSVDQARDRWKKMTNARFAADFFALDCFSEPIAPILPKDNCSFDTVSMQFCMHYAFESEEKVRMMLQNVTSNLEKGGIFLGTTTDCNRIISKITDHDGNSVKGPVSFGNNVFSISFEDATPPSSFPYGHKFQFFLQDAVDAPEFVVYWDHFEKLAEDYGLKLLYRANFTDLWNEEKTVPEFKKLAIQMKVFTHGGRDGHLNLPPEEQEATDVYVAFAFLKI